MLSINRKAISIAAAAGFALLLVPFMALAQPSTATGQNPQASFAGKYEGTVKDETGEQKLTLVIIEDAGKYSGTLTTAKGSFKVLKGTMTNGTLILDIEKPGGASGAMNFRKNGEVLAATFAEAGKTINLDFRKASADEISGEWEAVADAQGQAFPFTLVLKLDGDKVTGSSNSQLGSSTISTGTWKDGKLAVILEAGSGQITLVATIVEGKLSGDYDFAGQTSGKWVAQKKKP
jgi:hypothetical protein